MATRQQNARKMTALRVRSVKDRLNNCIRGLMSFEYKNSKGEWNISKIAKDTRLSRTTIYKYLKGINE